MTISSPVILDALTIYNINGKKIREINKPENRINLNALSAGVYFLKFETKDTSVLKRIVKF
ncbi:T9SS type A sorting domain-containing protein [Hyunsoonleella sp. SJ7]|uniref:T9SS type A sorting domain-containing protein n=1 Tax=Hyunsoonleella aquatilis TaxID=2762758 RepID=A0A923KKT1_9FLAO|nr:T9SS type A sorting domain-containing protein [Hyunsoonleella aquatilis]